MMCVCAEKFIQIASHTNMCCTRERVLLLPSSLLLVRVSFFVFNEERGSCEGVRRDGEWAQQVVADHFFWAGQWPVARLSMTLPCDDAMVFVVGFRCVLFVVWFLLYVQCVLLVHYRMTSRRFIVVKHSYV